MQQSSTVCGEQEQSRAEEPKAQEAFFNQTSGALPALRPKCTCTLSQFIAIIVNWRRGEHYIAVMVNRVQFNAKGLKTSVFIQVAGVSTSLSSKFLASQLRSLNFPLRHSPGKTVKYLILKLNNIALIVKADSVYNRKEHERWHLSCKKEKSLHCAGSGVDKFTAAGVAHWMDQSQRCQAEQAN